ncbi:MAG TPA: ferrochelatase [Anaerolineales bacterium]
MSGPIGVLVMAYGGPRRLEEVEPYLMHVRDGRPLPERALQEVVERYRKIGGGSPILQETQAQAAALQRALDRGDQGNFRVFLGMRHWQPFLEQTVEQMAQAGLRRLVGIVMAPHYSRLSVEAYFSRVEKAMDGLADPPELARIESWKTDPGYLETVEAHICSALENFPVEQRAAVQLIFTAHSLPERILTWNDPYPEELRQTFETLRLRFPSHASHFAYQSAAMTPDPWLGPDAGKLMLELIGQGAAAFLVVPIGFVCEHVEILYDVDIDYRQRVEQAGARLERIEMPGAEPRMMNSLAGQVRQAAQQAGWL